MKLVAKLTMNATNRLITAIFSPLHCTLNSQIILYSLLFCKPNSTLYECPMKTEDENYLVTDDIDTVALYSMLDDEIDDDDDDDCERPRRRRHL